MSFAVKLVLILLPILVQSEQKFNRLYEMMTYHSGVDSTNFIYESNLNCTIRDHWYARIFFYEYDSVSPNDFIAQTEIFGEGNGIHSNICIGFQHNDVPNNEYTLRAVVYHDCADQGREKTYTVELGKVPTANSKNVTIPFDQQLDNQGTFLIPAHFDDIKF